MSIRLTFIVITSYSIHYTKLYEILGIIRDTTERRKMEDLIRASEHKYRDIYENAIEGIFQTTIKGEILSVNNSLAQMCGYNSPEEFMSRVHDISNIYVNLEDRLRILKALDQHRSVQNIQLEFLKNDGEKRWISLNARIVFHPAGDYIEGSVVDVTEEVLLRKNLEEKERIYRLLAENVSDVIWTADMNMRLNVITSYSIHYTKLYERCSTVWWANAWRLWTARPVRRAIVCFRNPIGTESTFM